MGRFTQKDLVDSKGLIRDIFKNTQNNCSPDDVDRFSKFTNNFDRFCFVAKIADTKKFPNFVSDLSKKSEKLAQGMKQKGNEAFQMKHWRKAAEFYNASLLLLPSEKKEDFAILLANRSAALYHMEQYQHALCDIEVAEENYPRELMYKLKERKAKCLLSQKDHERALKAFQETVKSLDESKLPLEKRFKLEKDAQIMIKMLPKTIEVENKMKKLSKNGKEENGKKKYDKIFNVDYNEKSGRFVTAKRDIKVAEEILSEKAHVAILNEKFSKTHCQNCFVRSFTPLPCPNCTDVVFCSIKCRGEALASYHRYECGTLETIWKSGASINCHMALRIISQSSLDHFKSIRSELAENLSYDTVKNLPSSDYRRVFILVRHENRNEFSKLFQYSFMAVFFVELLKSKGFFGTDPSEDDLCFIGSLIAHNLQFLQFNSHEMFDLLKSRREKISQTVEIGAGLFPTLALFNHSCNPSIVRYFRKTSVVINAIRSIKAGDMIAENYGAVYSQDPKSSRRSKLKETYWFDCDCEACEQNWPIFSEMNTNEIRFKCNGSNDCDNVIAIPVNCNEFMIRCIKCGEFTNILKGLKAVQDTEMLEKTAKRLFNEGNVNKALSKYIEMMNILEENLVPPFQDYCKCQIAIQNCLMEYGNCVQVD